MSIRERILDDLKAAMKSGEKLRLGTLRMLKAKMVEAEVEARAKRGRDYQLDDDAAIQVLSSYAKQRRDSIEGFRQGGRADLVAREEAELAVVQEYLPQPLDEAELRRIVEEAIAELRATSAKQVGAVMQAVMPRVRGRADGKAVNQMVRSLLPG